MTSRKTAAKETSQLLKDQSFLRENDSKMVCILWSGGVSDFTANFG